MAARPSGRAAGRAARGHAGDRRQPLRRGLVPGLVRPHPGAGDRQPRRDGARLPARPRPGLGHRRVRHAAAGHPHPRPARGGRGQAVRPQPGDPAADRPLSARRHRPAGARRAAVHPRLRRHPGRRRHPHRGDHRRLGGAAARHPLAEGRRRDQGRSDPRPRRRHLLRRAWPTRPGARPRLRGGLQRRGRRQLRADRRRRHRRDPGHRREARLHPRRVRAAVQPGPGRHLRADRRCRRRRSLSGYPAMARSGSHLRCRPAACARGGPASAGRRGSRRRRYAVRPVPAAPSWRRARPLAAPSARPDRHRRPPLPAGASSRRGEAGRSAPRSRRRAARGR